MLIALAGLQGVGKSTVAEALAAELDAVVLSVDVIESALLRSQIERSFGSGLAAYIVAEDLAAEELRRGRTVIVDAANYVQVARRVDGAGATNGVAAAVRRRRLLGFRRTHASCP